MFESSRQANQIPEQSTFRLEHYATLEGQSARMVRVHDAVQALNDAEAGRLLEDSELDQLLDKSARHADVFHTSASLLRTVSASVNSRNPPEFVGTDSDVPVYVLMFQSERQTVARRGLYRRTTT